MAFPITADEHEAIKARIDGQDELVISAAILVGELIVSVPRPGRHGNIIWPLHAARLPHDKHGFLTNRGRFLDRRQAADLIAANGQGSIRDNCNGHLFSEDLWNEEPPSDGGGP